ncbi:hypothetical protein WAI453_001668 [Rhynchosporium graminicola]
MDICLLISILASTTEALLGYVFFPARHHGGRHGRKECLDRVLETKEESRLNIPGNVSPKVCTSILWLDLTIESEKKGGYGAFHNKLLVTRKLGFWSTPAHLEPWIYPKAGA